MEIFKNNCFSQTFAVTNLLHDVVPFEISQMNICRKEYGLEVFLPAILLDNVRRKDIKKHLRFYLKKDSNEGNNISSCALGACAYLNEPSC